MKREHTLFIACVIFYSIGCSSQDVKMKGVDTTIMTVDTTVQDANEKSILKGKMLEMPQFYNVNLQAFLTRPNDEFFPEYKDVVGYVLLEPQQFAGNNIPFLCYASENITELYVDNKRVKLVKEKEFFFRQTVKLYSGYNRIPIKIINNLGKVTETYLEMNMKSTIIR